VSDTPLTDSISSEGEGLYLDQGGSLTHEQRDKLFTKAMDRARSLERVARQMAEALEQLSDCYLTDDNCASFKVANSRIQNIANPALAAWRELEERK